jgi:hypothetical protein
MVAPRTRSKIFKTAPQISLTEQQWLKRVDDARPDRGVSLRMRVRGLQILRHRKDEAKAADQRVLYDPSLRPGDIVATSPGFVVFVGRDSEERRLGDLLPAPSGVSTADAPTQSRTLGRLRHFTKIRPPARSHGVDPRPVKKILCN